MERLSGLKTKSLFHDDRRCWVRSTGPLCFKDAVAELGTKAARHARLTRCAELQ